MKSSPNETCQNARVVMIITSDESLIQQFTSNEGNNPLTQVFDLTKRGAMCKTTVSMLCLITDKAGRSDAISWLIRRHILRTYHSVEARLCRFFPPWAKSLRSIIRFLLSHSSRSLDFQKWSDCFLLFFLKTDKEDLPRSKQHQRRKRKKRYKR